MPTNLRCHRHPVRGMRAAVVAALAALAVAACSENLAQKALYANSPFGFSLFSLSGSGPANAPAALDFGSLSAVRVDGALAFDVAFDFDGAGKIRVIPQKLVGASILTPRTIALQRVSGVYETILIAPSTGYVTDSVVSVLPGEVLVVRMVSPSCAYQISSELYAKLVVDSVKTGGLIFGRGMLDPNCGFKSLDDGIPKK